MPAWYFSHHRNIESRDTWWRTNRSLNCIKQTKNIMKYELYTNASKKIDNRTKLNIATF